MYTQEISRIISLNCRETETPWMLPEDFKVYVSNNPVMNYPNVRFEERVLPTFNHYKGADGGYVAIYSHSQEKAVYGVGGDVYVVGQVRMQGRYEGRIFVPSGFELEDDITQDTELLKICEMYFPEMKGQMWIGGETGGWFGIPGPDNGMPISEGQKAPWMDQDSRRWDSEGWPIDRNWD